VINVGHAWKKGEVEQVKFSKAVSDKLKTRIHGNPLIQNVHIRTANYTPVCLLLPHH
jgi:hypothetical protein